MEQAAPVPTTRLGAPPPPTEARAGGDLAHGKEWWMNRARREGDHTIGAGAAARDPQPDESPRCVICGYDEESHKFVCACERFQPPSRDEGEGAP